MLSHATNFTFIVDLAQIRFARNSGCGAAVIWFIRKRCGASAGLSMPQFARCARFIVNRRRVVGGGGAFGSVVADGVADRGDPGEEGFAVAKGSSADRRQMELVLTAEGLAVLEEGWRRRRRRLRRSWGAWAAERATLEQAMKYLKSYLGRWVCQRMWKRLGGAEEV